jgi:hypothetical protein
MEQGAWGKEWDGIEWRIGKRLQRLFLATVGKISHSDHRMPLLACPRPSGHWEGEAPAEP